MQIKKKKLHQKYLRRGKNPIISCGNYSQRNARTKNTLDLSLYMAEPARVTSRTERPFAAPPWDGCHPSLNVSVRGIRAQRLPVLWERGSTSFANIRGERVRDPRGRAGFAHTAQDPQLEAASASASVFQSQVV